MDGRHDFALTVMDLPNGCSIYPWDETRGLSSLSSAKWTPFSKTCKTYAEAQAILDGLKEIDLHRQADGMIASMEYYFPAIRDYQFYEHRLSIRAMPMSGADTRLVDVQREGKLIRVRAGKIDAVIHAQHEIERIIGQ
jgi:hypothetical protein